ncbi:uncharacterized protein LOC108907750 [Anoplophora glabripennis]|uniref:uncharacterized protein LOC108907750 n=1 Tax=Anoplophora glabripennis TaxID=217634 RepID=UPI000874262B|nr:uncharacterized protein LOC108907750 [Anoplophora glabripennis]
MKNSANFNKRTIWRLLISLIVCSATTADSNNCTQPETMLPTTPLFIYQQTAVLNTAVYHCLYNEDNVCHSDVCLKCKWGNTNSAASANSSHRFSDITNTCLKAFDTNKYTNVYGHSYNNYTVYKYEYTCENNARFDKFITIIFTKYYTEADVVQDKIVLRSGTACKYSTGFCHDDRDNIDVMWKTNRADQLSCNSLRRVNVSNSYHMYLNGKNYAIVESEHKYFAFDWNNVQQKCGVTAWEVQKGALIVTSQTIVEADNRPVQSTDHLRRFFRVKQNLYDFLIEKCIAELNTTNLDAQYEALFDKFKLRDETNYLNKLDREYRRFLLNGYQHDYVGVEESHAASWKLTCAVYILITVVSYHVLLAITFVTLFLFRSLRKYLPKKRNRRPEAARANFELKPTRDLPHVYDSPTSE